MLSPLIMKGTSPGILRFMFVMIIGTTLTWTTGLADIQYVTTARIAFQTGFPGHPKNWTATGVKSNIQLGTESIAISRNRPGRSYAKYTVPLPMGSGSGERIVRITGKITTLKKASAVNTKPASYMAWFLDQNAQAIQYSTVQEMSGDFREYRAERTLSAPDAAEFLVLALLNNDSDGHFALIDATADLVASSQLYHYISTVLFVYWGLLFGFVVYRLARVLKPIQTAVMGALIAATVVGTLLPEVLTTRFVLPAFESLISYLSADSDYQLGQAYKIGHFVFFFLVTMFALANSAIASSGRVAVTGIVILFALATEGFQLHLFHRSTRLADLGIDLAGIVTAIIWLLIAERYSSSKR